MAEKTNTAERVSLIGEIVTDLNTLENEQLKKISWIVLGASLLKNKDDGTKKGA